MLSAQFDKPEQRRIFLILLALVSFGLAFLALILPSPFNPSLAQLEVGQVAPARIAAPKAISYESQVLTAKQREAAQRSVAAVYTPPDTSVARQQVARLRDVLAYISSVRADQYASKEQKEADLAAIADIKLQPDTIEKILSLSDARWQTVEQEAVNVLEQVMRNTIRESRLDDTRRSVPALVSLSLPEDQASIVAELAAAFVVPNSLYSEELTQAARKQAVDGVQPVVRTYKAGETVIEEGQVISETDIEALEKLDLIEPAKSFWEYLGAAGLTLIVLGFSAIYLKQRTQLLQNPSALVIVTALFMSFLYVARFGLPWSDYIPYMMPLSAFSLALASLFSSELAFIVSLPLALLVTYAFPDALSLMVYHVVGTMFGIFSLGQAQRVFSFLRASAISAFSGAIIASAYLFLHANVDLSMPIALAGAAAVNGIISAGLTLAIQYFVAQALGMVSPLQLNDLTRPDQPLLRLLMRAAPGTYQHSLQVANLAEQAAEQIGAHALLARVGALYHDIGKTRNASYFIENQLPGQHNPHDDLDPLTSAAIIIRHVIDGAEMARAHRLPRRLQDFILEHHGNATTRYQYVCAVKLAGGDESRVNKEAFCYPGPRPQSRETGIVMLCDGCEAATRAKRPKEESEIQAIVESVFEARLKENQLDDTALTFSDLAQIKRAIIETLKGIYHPRIEYPELEKPDLLISPVAREAVLSASDPTDVEVLR